MKSFLKNIWPQFLIFPILGRGSPVVDSHRFCVAIPTVMSASDYTVFVEGRPFLRPEWGFDGFGVDSRCLDSARSFSADFLCFL
jgi:hypothetical protein